MPNYRFLNCGESITNYYVCLDEKVVGSIQMVDSEVIMHLQSLKAIKEMKSTKKNLKQLMQILQELHPWYYLLQVPLRKNGVIYGWSAAASSGDE